MTSIPERIMEEACRLAKEAIFHGGVDWAAGDIAKALAAAEQRGREMERERCLRIADEAALKCEWTDGVVEAGKIATAIRSRSEGKGSE